jgi:hypothetical protein
MDASISLHRLTGKITGSQLGTGGYGLTILLQKYFFKEERQRVFQRPRVRR